MEHAAKKPHYTPPPARLHVVFARDAPIAVILRRGPRRHVRLILWHTDTDTFEFGQWLKGHVADESVSLSPDGQLFAYETVDYSTYAWNHSKVGPGWAAVSRPPYFTAIGLWSTGPCYGGGRTRFIDNQTLCTRGCPPGHLPIPADFRVLRSSPVPRWPAPMWRAHGSQALRQTVIRDGKILVFDIFGDGARIERELADFNDMAFEPTPPPEWALRWPDTTTR